MNSSKSTMSWSRGRASTLVCSDQTSNGHSVDRKSEISGKKSIASRMKKLFQPKPRKPVGELPDGLKGFFEPVARPVNSPSPAEFLSDSEYKPPTEREWNYLMTEPIFEKGFRQPAPFRPHTAAAINPNPQTPSVNKFRISHVKNQFIGSCEKSSHAETRSQPSSRSLGSNTSQVQAYDGRISYGKDDEFFRYANTAKIEDWVEEVRCARGSI